jgi:hypothetical protein
LVERQHLSDQRGADIGAQHDRERGHEVDQPAGGERCDHQAGGRAALQDRGHADAGQKGFEPIAERVAQDASQLRAEGARDPGLDHVHAPDHEGDRTRKIHEREGGIHPARSASKAAGALSPLYALGTRSSTVHQ